MDTPDPLRRAAGLVPQRTTSAAGTTTADAIDLLDHHEDETALDILTGLGDAFPAHALFWDLLATAATDMNLHRAKAWCNWRAAEAHRGTVRADLHLLDPTQPGARRIAVPGAGILRPLWHIGLTTADGHPDLRIARIWVEQAPHLAPGAHGPVRLAPLSFDGWSHLRSGDQITMHEQAPPAGTATITQISPPPREPKPRPG